MISIIIPTFNRERTIKRAIESCLNQTYKDIEVIVVDDCSTDDTRQIVKNINDKRLRYYKLDKNSGACEARNKGIEFAKGDYIAFQDSDDYWKSDKLEKQIINLNKNNSDVDFCKISVIGENKNKANVKPSVYDLYRIKFWGVKKALCYNSFISTQSIIGKKECFQNIIFDKNLPRLQDYDMMLRIISKYKVSITNEELANVYVQEDSISRSTEKLIKACKMMLQKKYELEDKDCCILRASLNKILGDCYKNTDIEKSKYHYTISLKNKFNFKIFIKTLL